MKLVIIFTFSFLVSLKAIAEGPPWKRITNFSFANNRVALTLEFGPQSTLRYGPIYYELSKEKTLLPIDQTEYFKTFQSDEKKSSFDEHPIKTSDGRIVLNELKKCEAQEEGDAYCKEVFAIYLGHKFPLEISKQCQFGCKIVGAEVIGENLWLSLGFRGEYVLYGSGVQVYSLKNYKMIFSYEGVLASIIRQEPSTDNVWIGTDKGITIVNLKLKKTTNYFFYHHFNKDGLAQFDLAPVEKESDPYAELARDLNLKTREFFDVVKKMPPFPANGLNLAINQKFLPKTYNGLLPFFLNALKKENEPSSYIGFENFCLFDDPLVKNYVLEQMKNKDKKDNYVLMNCLRKFSKSL